MANTRGKGYRQLCSYCGLPGHQARTCHVALEERHPDEHDEAAFQLTEGWAMGITVADVRRRLAEFLRERA
jgi:hypothetical protein